MSWSLDQWEVPSLLIGLVVIWAVAFAVSAMRLTWEVGWWLGNCDDEDLSNGCGPSEPPVDDGSLE